MAKKKITKANVLKLNKVASTLKTFTDANSVTASSTTGPIIPITDVYAIGNSGNQVTFDLVYNTKGVGALTDASLHSAATPNQIIGTPGMKDSLQNILVGTDTSINGSILKIQSIVTASPLTPVPAALDVDFTLNGGNATKNFPVSPGQFNKVGDSFILDITIIIF